MKPEIPIKRMGTLESLCYFINVGLEGEVVMSDVRMRRYNWVLYPLLRAHNL
jgi:hypothetical protein